LVIKFSQEFAELSAEEFVQSVLVEGIGVSEIVLGHNHHFGKGRSGNVEMLKKLSTGKKFSVIAVDDCKFGTEIVSSTKIRKALENTNIETANKMLGRYYSFNGKVTEGDKRGRKLGYPTANIKISDTDKLIPAIGIYAVKIKLNGNDHIGLLSIGKRPTFYESGELVSEVYIYDFDENIYGKKIKVEMVERIRGEEKFSSAEELINQMNKDKVNGLKIFNELNN
jgi:riboflavin kinase/FMN adenylyltransferase